MCSSDLCSPSHAPYPVPNTVAVLWLYCIYVHIHVYTCTYTFAEAAPILFMCRLTCIPGDAHVHHATPCHTTPHHATPCHTMHMCTTPCHALPYPQATPRDPTPSQLQHPQSVCTRTFPRCDYPPLSAIRVLLAPGLAGLVALALALVPTLVLVPVPALALALALALP